MTRFLFGTDIPDPTMPFEAGDDGEYEPDPMAHVMDVQNARIHRESAQRAALQVGVLFVFAVALLLAALYSAGIIHG